MKDILYNIILLRHAQSVKNLKKIHGGSGEELTEYGVEQAMDIGKLLKQKIKVANTKLFASTSYHTQATAEVLSKELGIPVEKPFMFKPLYLGIADGKSEDELMKTDYSSHMLFQQWRRREIDIKELVVPQMESYMGFWERGLKLIDSIAWQGTSILVCSNSLMILLTHIMLANHPIMTDRYRHIDIQNCGLISFRTKDYKDFSVFCDLTTVKQVLDDVQKK